MISTQLIAGDFNLVHTVKVVVARKVTIFPFCALLLRCRSLSSAILKVRGLGLHLLERDLSKDLWSFVKSTTIISKFGRQYFETMKIPFFLLNIFPTDFSIQLNSVDLACSNYYCGVTMIFCFPHSSTFINWNFLVRNITPAFIYLFNYLFLSLYTHGYLFYILYYNSVLWLFIRLLKLFQLQPLNIHF